MLVQVAAPVTIPLADAAALPLAGLTAWQVIDRAGLTEGERVLVNGAGGGIGGFAVRLAKRAGERVIATAGRLSMPSTTSPPSTAEAKLATSAARSSFVREQVWGEGGDPHELCQKTQAITDAR